MKEYHLFLKIEGDLERIVLLITVDAFINIYLPQNEVEINNNTQHNLRADIDFSLKIDSTLITCKEGDIGLLLTTKKILVNEKYNSCNTMMVVFGN